MSRTPISTLDPRVALGSPVAVDTALLTVGTEAVEIAGVAVAVVCLIAARQPVLAGAMAMLEVLVLTSLHVVLPGWHGTGAEILSTVLFALSFTYRFAVAGVVAWTLIGGITTGGLQAVLGWSRAPRIFAVPATVAVRFLPVVVDDARTIRDNLVLRGVVSSGFALLIHPVIAVRNAILPLVATSLRTGDELAASALLRGLGGAERPTAVVRLRLTAADGLAIAITVGVIGLALREALA